MDRQTDRQTTCHSNTALCVASRGKKEHNIAYTQKAHANAITRR